MNEIRECAHCGRPFEAHGDVGRPAKYCRRSCRQRAFEQRRHQGDLAWSDDRLVVMARRLAEMEDHLDRLREVARELRDDVEDDVGLTPSDMVDRVERALAEGSVRPMSTRS